MGLPVLPRSPSSMRADATTPAGTVWGVCRLLPVCPRTSPNLRWVVSRIMIFGACSAFTRVPARMVAELLSQPFYLSASNHVVASTIRSGCYQPKRQLLRGVRTR